MAFGSVVQEYSQLTPEEQEALAKQAAADQAAADQAATAPPPAPTETAPAPEAAPAPAQLSATEAPAQDVANATVPDDIAAINQTQQAQAALDPGLINAYAEEGLPVPDPATQNPPAPAAAPAAAAATPVQQSYSPLSPQVTKFATKGVLQAPPPAPEGSKQQTSPPPPQDKSIGDLFGDVVGPILHPTQSSQDRFGSYDYDQYGTGDTYGEKPPEPAFTEAQRNAEVINPWKAKFKNWAREDVAKGNEPGVISFPLGPAYGPPTDAQANPLIAREITGTSGNVVTDPVQQKADDLARALKLDPLAAQTGEEGKSYWSQASKKGTDALNQAIDQTAQDFKDELGKSAGLGRFALDETGAFLGYSRDQLIRAAQNTPRELETIGGIGVETAKRFPAEFEKAMGFLGYAQPNADILHKLGVFAGPGAGNIVRDIQGKFDPIAQKGGEVKDYLGEKSGGGRQNAEQALGGAQQWIEDNLTGNLSQFAPEKLGEMGSAHYDDFYRAVDTALKAGKAAPEPSDPIEGMASTAAMLNNSELAKQLGPLSEAFQGSQAGQDLSAVLGNVTQNFSRNYWQESIDRQRQRENGQPPPNRDIPGGDRPGGTNLPPTRDIPGGQRPGLDVAPPNRDIPGGEIPPRVGAEPSARGVQLDPRTGQPFPTVVPGGQDFLAHVAQGRSQFARPQANNSVNVDRMRGGDQGQVIPNSVDASRLQGGDQGQRIPASADFRDHAGTNQSYYVEPPGAFPPGDLPPEVSAGMPQLNLRDGQPFPTFTPPPPASTASSGRVPGRQVPPELATGGQPPVRDITGGDIPVPLYDVPVPTDLAGRLRNVGIRAQDAATNVAAGPQSTKPVTEEGMLPTKEDVGAGAQKLADFIQSLDLSGFDPRNRDWPNPGDVLGAAGGDLSDFFAGLGRGNEGPQKSDTPLTDNMPIDRPKGPFTPDWSGMRAAEPDVSQLFQDLPADEQAAMGREGAEGQDPLAAIKDAFAGAGDTASTIVNALPDSGLKSALQDFQTSSADTNVMGIDTKGSLDPRDWDWKGMLAPPEGGPSQGTAQGQAAAQGGGGGGYLRARDILAGTATGGLSDPRDAAVAMGEPEGMVEDHMSGSPWPDVVVYHLPGEGANGVQDENGMYIRLSDDEDRAKAQMDHIQAAGGSGSRVGGPYTAPTPGTSGTTETTNGIPNPPSDGATATPSGSGRGVGQTLTETAPVESSSTPATDGSLVEGATGLGTGGTSAPSSGSGTVGQGQPDYTGASPSESSGSGSGGSYYHKSYGSGGYSRSGSSKKKKRKGGSYTGGGGGMWPGFPFNRPDSPLRQHVLDAIALSLAKGKYKD